MLVYIYHLRICIKKHLKKTIKTTMLEFGSRLSVHLLWYIWKLYLTFNARFFIYFAWVYCSTTPYYCWSELFLNMYFYACRIQTFIGWFFSEFHQCYFGIRIYVSPIMKTSFLFCEYFVLIMSFWLCMFLNHV